MKNKFGLLVIGLYLWGVKNVTFKNKPRKQNYDNIFKIGQSLAGCNA